MAGYDEDSVTMVVAAVLDCMVADNKQADALFFATTTEPYKEKQSAGSRGSCRPYGKYRLTPKDFTKAFEAAAFTLAGNCR